MSVILIPVGEKMSDQEKSLCRRSNLLMTFNVIVFILLKVRLLVGKIKNGYEAQGINTPLLRYLSLPVPKVLIVSVLQYLFRVCVASLVKFLSWIVD
jgi:hypothetical protein